MMVQKAPAMPPVQYKAFVKTRSSYEPVATGEALYSWGRIGQGELTMWAKERFYYHTPQEMLNIPVDEIVSISAGYNHALFVTKQGDVYACGDNKFGCLGYSLEEVDYVDHFHIPRMVPNLSDKHIVKVEASNNLSAALAEDGTLYTWGFPGSYFTGMGALGRRTSKKDFFLPKRVAPAEDVRFKQVSLGNQHMLALGRDGSMWKWGKFPQGKDVLLPHRVDLPFEAKQVACQGDKNLLVLDVEGNVHRSTNGNNAEALQRIDGLSDICQVACGQTAGHQLALDRFGQVFNSARGGGEFKLLGGDILGQKIVQVACGANFAACVSDQGQVFTWGDFSAHKCGALGSGQNYERRIFFEQDTPKQVEGLNFSTCEQVVCGRTFCLALGVK